MKPVAYISRATLDLEKHWTPLDLEAGSIVWALKRVRGYLWETNFPHIFRPQGIGEYRHSGEPQCTSPGMARVPHRVRFRARVPQRQRKQQRRLRVTLGRACHGALPQWVNEPYPVEDGSIYLSRAC